MRYVYVDGDIERMDAEDGGGLGGGEHGCRVARVRARAVTI